MTTSLAASVGAEAHALPTSGESAEAILADLVHFLERYVVLSPEQVVASALWVVHTHAIEAAETTPYLNVSSAEKQSGKTRFLETLAYLVARPWFTGRTSVAALVRKLNKHRPTFLLDESDAAFRGESPYTEVLRGILNAGYSRSGVTTLCVGKSFEATDFQVFGPKAFAGIGDHLPDTVKDRSIPIRLKRKTSNEPVERFYWRGVAEGAGPLRLRVERWARANLHALCEARPEFPAGIGDRAADVWEPLFAIADLAGGNWPQRARHAAVLLMTGDDMEDQSTGRRLLSDVRDIFEQLATDNCGADRITSAALATALGELEESPWAGWHNGKPITPHGVAGILKRYRIRPRTIRQRSETLKGYLVGQFEDAFARYLPSGDIRTVTSVTTALSVASRRSAPTVTERPCDGLENLGKHSRIGVVTAVTVEKLARSHFRLMIAHVPPVVEERYLIAKWRPRLSATSMTKSSVRKEHAIAIPNGVDRREGSRAV